MATPSTTETDRLKKTYQAYTEQGMPKRRWSPENPGNREIIKERRDITLFLVEKFNLLPLHDKKILDVGCGTGGELAYFQQLGATPQNLYGLDIIPERIAVARKDHPEIIFRCGNAEIIAYPNQTFDIVLLFTVLSSILDSSMTSNLCNEVTRVVKPHGAVLFYDLRIFNPYNPSVQGITRRRLHQLFPGFSIYIRSLTMLPPLSRTLTHCTSFLYRSLARLPLLRTHNMGLMIKS